jgi:hypothetical protein
MKTRFVVLIIGLGLGLACAQNFRIDWHTIDGGGGISTGSVYKVSGTIGQPDASPALMTGGAYSVVGGFWALPEVVQIPNGPALSIVPFGVGQARLSWTPNTPGFVLQENTDLNTTNWVNSLSGATNPVVVPANLPVKAYRLHKP